jgi:hypothetical protein
MQLGDTFSQIGQARGDSERKRKQTELDELLAQIKLAQAEKAEGRLDAKEDRDATKFAQEQETRTADQRSSRALAGDPTTGISSVDFSQALGKVDLNKPENIQSLQAAEQFGAVQGPQQQVGLANQIPQPASPLGVESTTAGTAGPLGIPTRGGAGGRQLQAQQEFQRNDALIPFRANRGALQNIQGAAELGRGFVDRGVRQDIASTESAEEAAALAKAIRQDEIDTVKAQLRVVQANAVVAEVRQRVAVATEPQEKQRILDSAANAALSLEAAQAEQPFVASSAALRYDILRANALDGFLGNRAKMETAISKEQRRAWVGAYTVLHEVTERDTLALNGFVETGDFAAADQALQRQLAREFTNGLGNAGQRQAAYVRAGMEVPEAIKVDANLEELRKTDHYKGLALPAQKRLEQSVMDDVIPPGADELIARVHKRLDGLNIPIPDEARELLTQMMAASHDGKVDESRVFGAISSAYNVELATAIGELNQGVLERRQAGDLEGALAFHAENYPRVLELTKTMEQLSAVMIEGRSLGGIVTRKGDATLTPDQQLRQADGALSSTFAQFLRTRTEDGLSELGAGRGGVVEWDLDATMRYNTPGSRVGDDARPGFYRKAAIDFLKQEVGLGRSNPTFVTKLRNASLHPDEFDKELKAAGLNGLGQVSTPAPAANEDSEHRYNIERVSGAKQKMSSAALTPQTAPERIANVGARLAEARVVLGVAHLGQEEMIAWLEDPANAASAELLSDITAFHDSVVSSIQAAPPPVVAAEEPRAPDGATLSEMRASIQANTNLTPEQKRQLLQNIEALLGTP